MVNIFEINKLLTCIKKIANEQNQANRAIVATRYSETHYVEQISKLDDVIELTSKLELSNQEGTTIKITPDGVGFLNLLEKNLSPTEKQIVFLEEKIKKINLDDEFEKLFSNFKIDFTGEQPVWRSTHAKFQNKTDTLDLLQELKIIEKGEDGLFIPTQKNHLVSYLRNKRKFPKTNFEEINKKKSEIGNIGENLTMEYELNRLNENEDLRQRILQISEIDDTAGFDIMSFDGEKSTEFDRMIEVKATTDENPHFFFSGHEVEVASYLKNKYWIYLWTAVFGTPKLTKIKNPYEKVFIKSKVKPEPASFYINKNLIENIEQS